MFGETGPSRVTITTTTYVVLELNAYYLHVFPTDLGIYPGSGLLYTSRYIMNKRTDLAGFNGSQRRYEEHRCVASANKIQLGCRLKYLHVHYGSYQSCQYKTLLYVYTDMQVLVVARHTYIAGEAPVTSAEVTWCV